MTDSNYRNFRKYDSQLMRIRILILWRTLNNIIQKNWDKLQSAYTIKYYFLKINAICGNTPSNKKIVKINVVQEPENSKNKNVRF